MRINRQMAGLFFEIRRSVQPCIQDQLKISDPHIAGKLIILHNKSIDERLKSLIEQFIIHAGEQCTELAENLNKEASLAHINKCKLYDKILHVKQ